MTFTFAWLVASVSSVPVDIPDLCWCNGHVDHGAQCEDNRVLECAFLNRDPDGVRDVVNILAVIAQIPHVDDLTIGLGIQCGPAYGNAAYVAMGEALGAFPPSQLKRLRIEDERECGSELGNDGLVGFANGIVNYTALETLSWRASRNLGIGRLSCNDSSSLPGDAGFAGLGKAVKQIPSLLTLDLDFQNPAGAYRVCGADLAAFATGALAEMTQLQDLSLALDGSDVDDASLTVLGQSIQSTNLRGANFRFMLGEGGVGAQGPLDLVASLARMSQLQSVSLAFNLRDGTDCKTVADGLGASFAAMSALRSLWLGVRWPSCTYKTCDQVVGNGRLIGLKNGLGAVKTLEILHTEIGGMPCDCATDYCQDPSYGLADSITGTCLDCGGYFVQKEECNCWREQYSTCSFCDKGNFPVESWSECSNWPSHLIL